MSTDAEDLEPVDELTPAEDQRPSETLFEVEPDWADHWRGMPGYEQKDLMPWQTLLVHFRNPADKQRFAELVGQTLSERTKFIWYPRAEIVAAKDKRYSSPQVTPRYPIYIISKGRWDSRLTAKACEYVRVPYRIVVEPQEYEHYASVIDPAKILTLPFSKLGQGSIPARNWVWEHAVASGAERHWILDDNISGFCRFHENLKVEVDSGVTFCAVEDFVDRYENLVMAGFHYDYFAPRKSGAKIKPVVFNTRVYSGMLLSNKIPHRWRGRYNEDTDLSLRILRDGLCTALFNAFLMYKAPTLTMKGGNADELYRGVNAASQEWEAHAGGCATCRPCLEGYDSGHVPCETGRGILAKDGRWLMAESLREQHPDVTTVERKWGRWQHQVDYRRFRDNQLVMRPDVVIPEGANDYGMQLAEIQREEQHSDAPPRRRASKLPADPMPAGPSALDFASAFSEPTPVDRQPKSELQPEAGKPSTAGPGQPTSAPSALAFVSQPFDAAQFKAELEAKGHRLMTRDGRLLVSDSSRLTEDTRRVLKEYRDAFIALAEQVAPVAAEDPSQLETPREATPSAQTAREEVRFDPEPAPDGADGAGVSRPSAYDAERTSAPVPYTCKFCGSPSWIDPSDQAAPASYCHESDHGSPGSPSTGVATGQGGTPDVLGSAVCAHDSDERGGSIEPPRSTVSQIQTTSGQQPTSLAQLLGVQHTSYADWKPDELPNLSAAKEIVLNFATNGLSWVKGHRPVGLTVSTMDGQVTCFLPFAFEGGGNLPEASVKAWYLDQVRGKKIRNANTRFDLHMSRVWGVDLEEQGCTFSDVQHTAALLDDHRLQFRLDVLARDYLPELPVVERVDESRHAEYHAADIAARERFTAQLVAKLAAKMDPEIDRQELRAVQDLEDAVIPCVVEMEKNGAPIDMELLEQYHAECNKRHDALLWEVSKEVGFAFDHKPQSWDRLFEKLGLPVLQGHAEDDIAGVDHPTVKKAWLSSQLASLNSKIFKAYREMIGSDGILHFELNQLRGEDESGSRRGTVTGRFSAGFVQQVPNHDNHFAVFGEDLFPRRLYVAANGHRVLAADAAQIQYRIFAHHANNPRVLEMYAKDPRASFHRMIEGMLRPHKPDLVYSHVKNMNFMRIFGGGLAKLAQMMGYISAREAKELTGGSDWKRWDDPRLAKAKEIQQIYDRELPEVGTLLATAMHLAMNKCNDACGKNQISRKLHDQGLPHRGFVKTVLGRRSRFPDGYRLHKAFCMVDQGSEGDIVKTKVVELHRERKHTGLLMRMTVHDEVTGDAMADDTRVKVDEILNRQSFPQLKVPILWDCGEGQTWADCK